jgi:hypothetical protein
MLAKMLAEKWDKKTEKWETDASFDAFDVFYDHVMKSRKDSGANRLRVHIPGDFKLTSHDREKLGQLRIERF